MCDKTSQKLSDIKNEQINENVNNLLFNTSIDCNYDDLGEGTSYGSHHTKYLKDSIDRFDDDLIENILSYLSFSDKVLFESISKQWKRVIFNKQIELRLNRSETEDQNTLNKLLKAVIVSDYSTGYAHYAGFKTIMKQSFESVLKKCEFITTIQMDCYCDGEDLELLVKYCNNLNSFECESLGLNEQNLLEFGIKYGHRLKKLLLYNSMYGSVFIKKFLNYCNNLTEVYSEENTAFISDDKLFLPKLQVIKTLDIRSENFSHLRILSEKYFETMRKIRIYCYDLKGNECQTALSHISQFKNLKRLFIYLSSFDSNVHTIDDNIIELAKNCTQLKELEITLGNKGLITERLFYSFANFCSLEKLSLYVYDLDIKLEGNVMCFESCLSLKHLVMYCNQLSDDFFHDIHLFLPNLNVIDIDFESEITDKTIISISKLEKLRQFYFRRNRSSNKLITDESVCQLINSCENIEVITFNARPNITHKTIDTLISSALKKSRKQINFFCGFSHDGDEAEFEEIDLNTYADSIPQNLIINIVLGNFFNE